jgi:hypothetical protein
MSSSTADPPDAEIRELRRERDRLSAENARLERFVGLIGPRALPDEAARSPLFGGHPGAVDGASSSANKVTFVRHLFAGRDDVHALRWENDRTRRAGWMPAVEGGFRRGQTNRTYLPLTDDVITAHLMGDIHTGLYPLMAGDTCRLLACDFDGPSALLDALAYTKAVRAFDIPTALEISRSGSGAHVWIFFTGSVAATTARRVGAGLIREAIAIRGELDGQLRPVLPSAGLPAGIGVDRQSHRASTSRHPDGDERPGSKEIDGPTLRYTLQEVNGSQIALPTLRSARPDPELLEIRWW